MAVGKRRSESKHTRPKTTLIAAKLSNANKSSAINIGRAMLLVIDGKTHHVKHLLNPRKYKLLNEAGMSPVYIEELVDLPNFNQYVDCKNCKCSQMTL